MIPLKYTRDGQNVSPPLEWHDAPEQTRSYALVVEDPDAPS
ncbi:MAG: YbhB/YbcL family Raf kinase inhibitor-like protein, partial [Gemmatimonadales bacterium]